MGREPENVTFATPVNEDETATANTDEEKMLSTASKTGVE